MAKKHYKPDDFLTVSMAAEWFGVGRGSIWHWCRESPTPLPHTKVGNVILIRFADIVAYDPPQPGRPWHRETRQKMTVR